MVNRSKKSISPLILILTVALVVTFSISSWADPEAAKEKFNEGLKFESKDNINGAILAYQICIKEDDSFIDAYINLGTIHFKQKEYDKALNMFKSATEKDKTNKDAFANLGKVEYILKKYAESETAFKAAISLDGSDAGLHKELGKVFYKKRNYKEVITTFNKCHELGGGDHLTYYMLGKGYQKTGDNAAAITALKQSTTKKKSYYSAHSTLGTIYLGQEKYNQAAKAFKAALNANPKKYKAAYNYAIAMEYKSPDNFTSNITNWEQFIRIAKANPKAKQDVSIAQEHVKELKAAKEQSDLQ